MAASAGADGRPAGPPAPPARAELLDRSVPESREQLAAERAWPWYAGAWAVNSLTTVAAVELGGGRESNPLFRDHPDRAIAAKAGAAVVAWHLEVWAARRGRAGWGRVGRWIFVGLSALVAGHEINVAF